ncbi:MAG: hypothetical protein CL927_16360 [Deltaproteobacteria bacterium]|nr:hypothetical protein [Deltaproteobacteria bacterium]HCH65023.1 hypothetical protein [Deltaproteobacteria bacterium]
MRPHNPLAPGRALVPVDDKALKTLLRALYRGDLTLPLDLPGLTRVGLQYCSSELLHHLRGLDKGAVQAVVVAVLAERRAASEAR